MEWWFKNIYYYRMGDCVSAEQRRPGQNGTGANNRTLPYKSAQDGGKQAIKKQQGSNP